jgi:hypothetical protein
MVYSVWNETALLEARISHTGLFFIKDMSDDGFIVSPDK